ncbi:MAG: hypothetical protein AB7I33_12025 [Gemmatimonadales bacterium]
MGMFVVQEYEAGSPVRILGTTSAKGPAELGYGFKAYRTWDGKLFPLGLVATVDLDARCRVKTWVLQSPDVETAASLPGFKEAA